VRSMTDRDRSPGRRSHRPLARLDRTIATWARWRERWAAPSGASRPRSSRSRWTSPTACRTSRSSGCPTRPCRRLARAAALLSGITRAYVPIENAGEAAALGADAIAFGSLRDAVAHFEGVTRQAPVGVPPPAQVPPPTADLRDIVGQETPKRALEIAAAGAHNLLLVGPPGTGKTLLARALPSILPPLDPDEAVEASAVHSVAGLIDPERPLLVARPFRAPHHTASHLALVGGGTPPRPGEVSLAHAGALFLDEFAEYQPQALDTLREPLEEGAITISRAGGAATYPARFVLVAAMNPCPCGHAGDAGMECTCLPDAVDRYRGRIS